MEQIFELFDYKIFTKTEGEGAPLLLLHSYWGNLTLFDQLARDLSQNWQVIRIDLPGHGNSGVPPVGYTFGKFAVVLNELLIRLNISKKVSIIGHSMGGYAAMAFAAIYPERIASLVLMHSPVRAADIQSIKLREREGRLLSKGKKELLLQLTIPSNFASENIDSMGNALTMLNQSSAFVTPEGALGSIFAINHRVNSLPMLQSAQYPILIIIGRHDKVYGPDLQLNDATLIPKAEVLLLNHSGHLGFMEEEQLVYLRLRIFLERQTILN